MDGANFLRNGEFNRALQMQGWVDGVESILSEVQRISHEKVEDPNPNY